MSAFVANYNVRHNSLVAQDAAKLDLSYLCDLGPSALPAVDWLYRNVSAAKDDPAISRLRDSLIVMANAGNANWRRWTLRDHVNLWRVERGALAGFAVSNVAAKTDRARLARVAPALSPAHVTPYGAAGSILTRHGQPS